MNSSDKPFRIPGDQIKRLIPAIGGCFASDRITVCGMKVGYMYRERPDERFDSGWRFMSGDENREYADNADNWGIYEVNTICNYDPAIIPYLNAANGTAYVRIPDTEKFRAEEFEPPDG